MIINLNHYKIFKVCLCTIGKRENLYAKEYVEYYINFGVDKIFIYDNNDINDEKFENVLSEYINKKLVEIVNYRGKNKIQMIAINDCYKKNFKKYDWIIFYDMDEFISLNNYKNIKNFLNEKRFKDCQIIQLNWVMHTDNNLIYYENKTLAERFKETGKKINGIIDIKSILRGHIKININSVHFLSQKLNNCDGFGKKKIIIGYEDKNPDYKYYYIDHYYTKSTEEFVNKITRGCVAYGVKIRESIIKYYFELNKITYEKIIFIENKTKINLSEYKNKINNKIK